MNDLTTALRDAEALEEMRRDSETVDTPDDCPCVACRCRRHIRALIARVITAEARVQELERELARLRAEGAPKPRNTMDYEVQGDPRTEVQPQKYIKEPL